MVHNVGWPRLARSRVYSSPPDSTGGAGSEFPLRPVSGDGPMTIPVGLTPNTDQPLAPPAWPARYHSVPVELPAGRNRLSDRVGETGTSTGRPGRLWCES